MRDGAKSHAQKAPTWAPVRRLDTTTIIVERIKSLLESGQLKPGTKLPSERELAKMLRVSRPSVRQALKSLSLMGILESKTGDGNYIRLSPSSGLAESLHFSVLFQSTSLAKVIEARKVVEIELAGMAARTATNEHLARLQQLIAAQKVDIPTVEAFNERDTDLHITIAEAAGNEVLLAVSKMLQRIASAGRRRTAYRYDLNRTWNEHRAIVEQIKARNIEGAREAMRDHLDNALTVVLASDILEVAELKADT